MNDKVYYCRGCEKEKPIKEMVNNCRYKLGVMGECKECKAKRNKLRNRKKLK